MEITPKVQKILEYLNEKTPDGRVLYTEQQIADLIGCTRQYISLIRIKYGVEGRGWANSPCRLENKYRIDDPKALNGLSIRDIAKHLQVTYAQARTLAFRYHIKVTRQKLYRPVSSNLPEPHVLLTEKKADKLSWKGLANRYQVSPMTLYRYLKRGKKKKKNGKAA